MPEFYTLKSRFSDRLIEEVYRASSVLTVAAYDEDDKYFLCDDGSVGIGFMCTPLTGRDEKIERQVIAMLNESYPAMTQMQFIWMKSPDIDRQMLDLRLLRQHNRHRLLSEEIDRRVDFLTRYTSQRMIIDHPEKGRFDLGYVNDVKLVVCLKIPISSHVPTRAEIDDLKVYQTKLSTSLSNIKLRPIALDASMWVRFVSTVFNWGDQAGWRHGAAEWDKSKPLFEQFLDYDKDIEVSNSSLRIGNQHVKTLSAKRMPDYAYFGDSMGLVGDLSGGMGGIKQNYIIVTNILLPETDSEKQRVERKRQFAHNQASGPMAKLAPLLVDKKNDFDVMYQAVNDGYKPLKISYHVIVFGSTEDDVEAAAMAARNFWRTQRFELMVDERIQLPILLNSMPFGCDRAAIEDIKRHKTLTSNTAHVLLPIFGEWKGTGTPHLCLNSRNNQVMTFSLHDTGSNQNAVCLAQSGSGKSFLLNNIISAYMSEGAQVWIIDVGRSYKKLVDVYGGDFVSFEPGSNICLNPFPLAVSLDGSKETRAPDANIVDGDDDDGEEDALVGLLEVMAAPTEKLSDFQLAALRKTVNIVWRRHFRDTTIDLIQQELLAHEDSRVRDIGHQLYAFTSDGSYGKYFNGPNNVKFNAQITCLELEELKSRKILQKAVLLQLLYAIQQEIYLGERNRKKLVVIDECWSLFAEGDKGVTAFIEHAFRRFRKYGASAVICSQGLADLTGSSVGRAIADNSATMLLLGQKPEAVEQARRDKTLELSEYHFDQLKSVHTVQGVYSEVFIKSEFGIGIARLMVDEFQQLLYSTKAEDYHAIKQRTDMGMSTEDAINDVLRERKQRRASRSVA